MTHSAPTQAAADDATFAQMVARPNLRSVAGATHRESRRRDIARIASTLFCGTDIDPSSLRSPSTAPRRSGEWTRSRSTCWSAARLLAKMSRLIADLHAATALPADAELPAAA